MEIKQENCFSFSEIEFKTDVHEDKPDIVNIADFIKNEPVEDLSNEVTEGDDNINIRTNHINTELFIDDVKYELNNDYHLEDTKGVKLEQIEEGSSKDMDYEKETQRLLKLFEEVLTDEETYEDNDDQSEIDHVEERSECSDTEQEFEEDDQTEEDNVSFRREPHFMGKDKLTKWIKHCPPKNVRTRSTNIYERLPAIKQFVKTHSTPIDIWNSMFDEEMLNQVVICTNIKIETVTNDYTRQRDAKPTDIAEIKALIGLLYLAGIRKANHMNLEDLWRTDGTGIETFRLVMSKSRFQFLLQCLRFDNIHTRHERIQADKLAPIRTLLEKFNSNIKKCYSHTGYVTIDEKLEAFRGKCSFRQYIPSKPNKYGIKIFAISDAEEFYTSHLEVYVGKQPNGPFEVSTATQDVVERLCAHIYGSNRNVTVDNWFCSVPLADSLKSKKLTLVGTIRKNKKQLPLEFVQNNGRCIGSSMFGFYDGITLVSHIPKKNRNVLLISTMHYGDDIDPTTNKPEMIITYNETKSGVDVVDKLCAQYNCARSTRRWPRVPFFSVLNVAGINSFVVYTTLNEQSKTPRKEFLLQLSMSLTRDYQRVRAMSNNLPRTIRMRLREICGLPTEQVPVVTPGTSGRCAVCDWKKNRKTKFYCQICSKYLCLEHVTPLCISCFKNVN
ncbi:uncharacterized protein LOC126886348 [Diabrotica virgifera virgifera]|uniref:PiggyBac transposable element-derived protein domain-containing protein n=1 Tax=Diabrotica virgifera virgifera TaxID=50390 RepID=A0ABM5KG73_DIAVI|nr:uncharacterized protein LOC126886348 [Diabrotica virgifera virgifera]